MLLNQGENGPELTREDLVNQFLSTRNPRFLRWCKAKYCGCMGCVNKSEDVDFKRIYPDESKITENEFLEFLKLMQEP